MKIESARSLKKQTPPHIYLCERVKHLLCALNALHILHILIEALWGKARVLIALSQFRK